MNYRSITARLACLVALAAFAAAPASAAPSVEQAKAESGLRFNEGAGLGQVRGETPAVWAGKASGRRANLVVNTPEPAQKPDAPPSPTPPGAPAKAPGPSIGTKIFIGLGAVHGAFATAGLVAACGAAPLILLGLGGAAVAASNAWKKGDRGWALAKASAGGAITGMAAIAMVGAVAGFAAGLVAEQLFKRR